MRRLATAAALVLAMIAATPADAGDYRRHGPGWGYAPGWHHAPPPPPRHWYRPYRPAPHWHAWRDERPRHRWREHHDGWGSRHRYAWEPRDRW